MPRIEIIPKDYNPNSGDGSPTIDVCKTCAKAFEDGGFVPTVGDVEAAGFHTSVETKAVRKNVDKLRRQYSDAAIGSVDVDHPPYEEDDYRCECCGKPLGDSDR